ncbi:MAG: ATP phosphoribosyltransferase [Gammaproteobacteria bacterium]|jgi:ATP phosphoribosyltransferase|nr:ATP phosphoribosyltransferase [Gammaproteobacteria bacterium]MBT4607423.1 ATP phosphoribosyltransferase [Thiotrichales bacterium]MBT3471653.1 ATP phosphoribosyltransferase [Gammaproteobacteria bacterium]MBT3966140.1 ATP phosphoribosyltransferase [Gammaproteobacteria bacterium]MBT4079186.1 ATP phosphoribosyltransferase [Gammaproteobacteria bacterium]
MDKPLTIALSKGRIYKDTLPLLEAAGIRPVDDPVTSRKLILDTNLEHVKVVVIRATDVPTFVERGVADLGVAGKDVLMEHGGANLYEPLDLQIAKCRMMTAGVVGAAEPVGRMRIATKYVKSAQDYFASLGQQVEIIKLYGAMELAPLVGLADRIVDLVETGNTLKANGLEPLEEIAHISSRLVVNKAAMKMKSQQVKSLIDLMSAAVEKRQG